jgi:hypothetical protein
LAEEISDDGLLHFSFPSSCLGTRIQNGVTGGSIA